MSIQEDSFRILKYLSEKKQTEQDSMEGRYAASGEEIMKETGLTAEKINDAVEVLGANALVEVYRYLGTFPFNFGDIELSARGRYALESMTEEVGAEQNEPTSPLSTSDDSAMLQMNPTPVGSPYGFTDVDWASVSADKQDAARIIVCFGYQWKSKYYTTADLEKNVEGMFLAAVNNVNKTLGTKVALDFKKLQGGYGGHLFNQIARDIIGADIAVFDTSEMNPNVMIELGVALTWGVSVLPIRDGSAPKPPNDISGQTWAEYSNSALKWADTQHTVKLEQLVAIAVKKKAGP